MIKIKENCFYNQKTIQFDEAKEELLIINRYLAEENLLVYLDTITFDKENDNITFILFNPKNNLKLKFCCTSYFKLQYLDLFDTKSCETIATVDKAGMAKLGVEAHEVLFQFFKKMFLKEE